jgi:hypothetical protein
MRHRFFLYAIGGVDIFESPGPDEDGCSRPLADRNVNVQFRRRISVRYGWYRGRVEILIRELFTKITETIG